MEAGGFATQILLALVPLFVVVDPLASIGLYLGLTARDDRRTKERIALRAVLFATVVLLAFAFAGQALLRFMGIELYSIRIAGGLLLALIGLNMLKEGEEVPMAELALPTGGVHRAKEVRHDPSLVPLGLPMLAGPGAISLVILLGTGATTPTGVMVVTAAIGITMLASLLVLLAASRASHVIGDNTRRVVTRIMGLLTVAFAVQYVLDGVSGWMGAGAA